MVEYQGHWYLTMGRTITLTIVYLLLIGFIFPYLPSIYGLNWWISAIFLLRIWWDRLVLMYYEA